MRHKWIFLWLPHDPFEVVVEILNLLMQHQVVGSALNLTQWIIDCVEANLVINSFIALDNPVRFSRLRHDTIVFQAVVHVLVPVHVRSDRHLHLVTVTFVSFCEDFGVLELRLTFALWTHGHRSIKMVFVGFLFSLLIDLFINLIFCDGGRHVLLLLLEFPHLLLFFDYFRVPALFFDLAQLYPLWSL